MMRAILLSLALLIIAVYFLSTSTSTTSLSAYLGKDGDLGARRARILEFTRGHDWEAELARAGLSPSADLAAKFVATLGGEPAEGDEHLVCWEMSSVYRGIPESIVGPGEMDRACRLIQARLSTECDIIWAETEPDPLWRTHLLWNVYGSGFDERALEFFAARRSSEPDPGLRALCEEFHRRLAADHHSQSP
jgi:hypothetical protein